MDIKKEKEDKGVFDPGVVLLKQDEKFFDNSNVDAVDTDEPNLVRDFSNLAVSEPRTFTLPLRTRTIRSAPATSVRVNKISKRNKRQTKILKISQPTKIDAMHINEPDERLNLPQQDVNEPTDIALKLNRRPIHSFKGVESVGVVQNNTGYEPQNDALPTRQPLSASALQLHEALNGYSTPLTFAQLMPSRDGEERDIRSDVAECGELPLGYVQGECMEEIGKL